jgi:hypothetical protein
VAQEPEVHCTVPPSAPKPAQSVAALQAFVHWLETQESPVPQAVALQQRSPKWPAPLTQVDVAGAASCEQPSVMGPAAKAEIRTSSVKPWRQVFMGMNPIRSPKWKKLRYSSTRIA